MKRVSVWEDVRETYGTRVLRTFDAEEVETRSIASSDRWFPEEDVVVGGLTVSENGVYQGPTLGGYDVVTVLVQGGNTAKVLIDGETEEVTPRPAMWNARGGGEVAGRMEDGNTYYVRNTNQGRAVKVMIPATAELEGEPTRTAYESGQWFNPAGMSVRLLNGDGTEATEWAGGHVASGSQYLHVPSVTLNAENGHVQTVMAYVRPFWFTNYESMDAETYGLPVEVPVTVV